MNLDILIRELILRDEINRDTVLCVQLKEKDYKEFAFYYRLNDASTTLYFHSTYLIDPVEINLLDEDGFPDRDELKNYDEVFVSQICVIGERKTWDLNLNRLSYKYEG